MQVVDVIQEKAVAVVKESPFAAMIEQIAGKKFEKLLNRIQCLEDENSLLKFQVEELRNHIHGRLNDNTPSKYMGNVNDANEYKKPKKIVRTLLPTTAYVQVPSRRNSFDLLDEVADDYIASDATKLHSVSAVESKEQKKKAKKSAEKRLFVKKTDETKVNEAIAKAKSLVRPPRPQLTSVFILNVMKCSVKDLKTCLLDAGFAARELYDVQWCAPNTVEVVIDKKLVGVFRGFVHRTFLWRTSIDFNPTKPFSTKAPEAIVENVFAAAVKMYARAQFAAAYFKKNTHLVDYRAKQITAFGSRFAGAAESMLKAIEASPQDFFRSFKMADVVGKGTQENHDEVPCEPAVVAVDQIHA
jgi:hypothetical protein